MSKIEVIVPGALAPFVKILGVDLTIKFLMEFGGAPVYLPNSATRKGGALAELVGREKALALGNEIGAGHYKVPTAKRWIAQHLYSEKNMSVCAICRYLHVTQPTVQNYIAKHRDNGQLNMFDA